jgi:RNA polymerase sigma-70 factor (ECF subfamily)
MNLGVLPRILRPAVTEQQAVALCRDGDPAGLAALVALHQADAVRIAALITRDTHLAEDVATDAFLVAYRRIGSFDPSRPFRPWFRRVVATTALKLLAARKGEVPLDELPEGIAAELADPADAAVWAARQEDRAAVRWALRALPPKQRAAIVLKYFGDLSEPEIACALGIPRGTVKSRLFNGLARLRVALARFQLA